MMFWYSLYTLSLYTLSLYTLSLVNTLSTFRAGNLSSLKALATAQHEAVTICVNVLQPPGQPSTSSAVLESAPPAHSAVAAGPHLPRLSERIVSRPAPTPQPIRPAVQPEHRRLQTAEAFERPTSRAVELQPAQQQPPASWPQDLEFTAWAARHQQFSEQCWFELAWQQCVADNMALSSSRWADIDDEDDCPAGTLFDRLEAAHCRPAPTLQPRRPSLQPEHLPRPSERTMSQPAPMPQLLRSSVQPEHEPFEQLRNRAMELQPAQQQPQACRPLDQEFRAWAARHRQCSGQRWLELAWQQCVADSMALLSRRWADVVDDDDSSAATIFDRLDAAHC